ncbi:MAG TPA: iron-sulfur cluster assembly protein [Chloroflexota bacterium]
MIDTPEAVSEVTILAALRRVSDPELDESIVELGFVDRVQVEGGVVDVVLRLPTFWCAPNFAYLMAHDARQEVLREPGVRDVRVALKDHVYSDEIGAGVTSGASFEQVFPGQADGDNLDDLRELFRTKAFCMRQEQLARFLLEAGLSGEELTALRLDDVVDTSDRSGLRLRIGGRERLLRGGAPLTRLYLDRRQRLGLASDRLIVDGHAQPIPAERLTEHLQTNRRQRISMTFNALMCRGLLETRYGQSLAEEQ